MPQGLASQQLGGEMKLTTFLLLEKPKTARRPADASAVGISKAKWDAASRAAFHAQELMIDLGTRPRNHDCRARAARDTTAGKG